jgi:hypothetical protein
MLSPSFSCVRNYIGLLARHVPKKQAYYVQASYMLSLYQKWSGAWIYPHLAMKGVTHLYGNDLTHPTNCSSLKYILSFTLSVLCTHDRHKDNLLLHRRCGPVLLNVAGIIWLLCGLAESIDRE